MTSFFQRSKGIVLLISFLCLPLGYFALKNLAVAHFATFNGGSGYDPPVRLANLENQSINESSGIASSNRNPDILWTHNDSGDGPFIYAFDRQGKHRGVWRVAGANAEDWEDMALGPGPKQGAAYLYLGDIGDNSKKRAQIVVYRVEEPKITPADSSSTNKKPQTTAPADEIRLKYPDGKHNAEALLVHPKTGDLYIVTKVGGTAAGVYKLKAPKSGEFTLEHIGEFSFPNPLGLITGGAISPEGRRLVLCNYFGACELILPEKPGVDFDEIWKQTPLPVDIGGLQLRKQGESICYRADGKALLATSEGRPCPLVEIVRTLP